MPNSADESREVSEQLSHCEAQMTSIEEKLEALLNGPTADLENRVEELTTLNSKLQYRRSILERSLREARSDDGCAIELLAYVRQIFVWALKQCARQKWAMAGDKLEKFVKNIDVQRANRHAAAIAATPSNGGQRKSKQQQQQQQDASYDFQCNSAFALSSALKQTPMDVGKDMVEFVLRNDTIEKATCTKGFINMSLKQQFIKDHMQRQLKATLTGRGLSAGLPLPMRKTSNHTPKVVIDYSSPNIAKEMHVGHLRSSIIGESIARLMRIVGCNVLPLNHLGDWGTQFGMLITYIQDEYPDYMTNPPELSDLVSFYKKARVRFADDQCFHRRSLDAVVRLQSYKSEEIEAWKLICQVSNASFKKIFEALDINVIDRGESFYQELMGPVMEELEEKGFITEEDGCKLMRVTFEMWDNPGTVPPLIMVKSDGGYTYDTSDVTALRQRLLDEHADCILYVVDQGQATHLRSCFEAARMAGWLDPKKHRVEHVGFGVVLGEDGKKFKTRAGETVKLSSLLETGLERAHQKLVEKGRHEELSPEEFEKAKKAVAYGCIKYADLSHSRSKDYIFSFDRMLDDKGNTAAYLLYSYTRIQSILRKACKLMPDLDDRMIKFVCSQDGTFTIGTDEKELSLCRQILAYPDVIRRASEDLYLHGLCEYIYELSSIFTEFYDSLYCMEMTRGPKSLAGNEQTEPVVHIHRLCLCSMTAAVFRLIFSIVGLTPVDRM